MTRLMASVASFAMLLAMTTACSGAEERSGSFSARPSDLPVRGVAACDTLSAEQRSDLGVGQGERDASDGVSDSCTWRSDVSQFWSVRLQQDSSIAQFNPDDPLYSGASEGFQNPRITTVDGYGAVEFGYSLGGDDPSCNMAIDAATNATVLVTYTDNGARDPRRPTTTIEQRCAIAAKAASMVITTMRSRAG